MAEPGQFQFQFVSIEPLRLYETDFVAELAGLSPQSIRKATASIRETPLIPRVTRLGGGTVRFAGRDILAWLDDPAAHSEQARGLVRSSESAVTRAAPVARRRPGRPRKLAQGNAAARGGAA